MAERNFLLRVASAVVGLPLLFALVLWREPWGFAAFAFVVVAVGLVEYTGLLLPNRAWAERLVVVAAGVGLAVGTYVAPGRALVWVMAAVIVVSVMALVRADEISATMGRLVAAGFGVVYVGGTLVALPLMHRDLPHGPLWVIAAIAMTFTNDTGAYFTGRAIGRHKLAPLISPGKTVEGAVGGLVASVAFLFVARATFLPVLSVVDCVVLGVGAGVLGPCGDLVESMMKRAAGAKDSGRLIPGHGGLLDRVDALMFVGAFVYAYARFFHGG